MYPPKANLPSTWQKAQVRRKQTSRLTAIHELKIDCRFGSLYGVISRSGQVTTIIIFYQREIRIISIRTVFFCLNEKRTKKSVLFFFNKAVNVFDKFSPENHYLRKSKHVVNKKLIHIVGYMYLSTLWLINKSQPVCMPFCVG